VVPAGRTPELRPLGVRARTGACARRHPGASPRADQGRCVRAFRWRAGALRHARCARVEASTAPTKPCWCVHAWHWLAG
jgi:hypothetical protein